jgi:hypothetical protein
MTEKVTEKMTEKHHSMDTSSSNSNSNSNQGNIHQAGAEPKAVEVTVKIEKIEKQPTLNPDVLRGLWMFYQHVNAHKPSGNSNVPPLQEALKKLAEKDPELLYHLCHHLFIS